MLEIAIGYLYVVSFVRFILLVSKLSLFSPLWPAFLDMAVAMARTLKLSHTSAKGKKFDCNRLFMLTSLFLPLNLKKQKGFQLCLSLIGTDGTASRSQGKKIHVS